MTRKCPNPWKPVSGHDSLRNHGPNDGLVLLSDLILPGGVTLAELGSDHFLLNGQIAVTTVALAITVIRWVENHDPKMPQSLEASVGK